MSDSPVEPTVRLVPCVIFYAFQVGFSAADAITGLKLVEAGVPKEQLALLAVPLIPLEIVLPLIISKYTAGPRPLNIFYKAFPFRYGSQGLGVYKTRTVVSFLHRCHVMSCQLTLLSKATYS